MATLVGEAAVRIVPSFENFRKRLEADLKSVNKHLDIDVRPQLGGANARLKAWRERQEHNALNIKVDVDDKALDDFQLKLNRTEHIFKKSALRQSLHVGIVVTGAAALPALANAAASATTAVTSLGQGLAILPGILSGVLASVGVLATGFGGIGTALQQLSQHQAEAASTARDVEKANRDLSRAQRDYNDAVRDAYRNLQDLKLELKGSSLSQADALISLREAERDYYKGGFKDALDQQRSWLSVLQAKQRVDEITLKNTRTNTDAYAAMDKGVSSADNVVDALDRVADATSKLTESSQGTETFRKAMAALSPAGREFVNQLLSMKGAWDELQQATQQHLFAGVADDIKGFLNVALPTFKKGAAQIADGFNVTIKGALGALKSSDSQGLLANIFGDTAGFWQNAAKGMQPLIDGFLRLSEVGAQFLPRLGQAFTDVLTRFDTFIQKAADDGTLNKWIDRGLNALTTLGNSFLNILSIFNSVSNAYRAVSGDQNGVIDSLGRGLESLANWAKSAQGQGSLIGYFKQAKDFIDRVTPGVKTLLEVLSTVGEAARSVFAFFSPIISGINDALGENHEILKDLLAVWLGWKLVKPLVTGVSTALANLNTVSVATGRGLGTLPGPLGRAQTSFTNAAREAGTAGIGGTGKGKGFAGALAGLGVLLGPGGLLLSIAIPAAIYGIDKLGEAHSRATQQAQAQNDALLALAGTMDDVSGAATKAGRSEVANQAQNFVIPGSAGPDGKRNILQDAQRVGIDSNRLLDLTDPTQEGARNTELQRLDAITLQKVQNSPDWQKGAAKWQEKGITADIMAKAIGGDQGAQEKVTAAQIDMEADQGIQTWEPEWLKTAERSAKQSVGALPGTQTDIMLGAGTPDSATTSTFLRKGAGTRLNLGAADQERARAVGGRNRLNAAGLGNLGAFAPSGDAFNVNGQVTQVLDKIPPKETVDAWNQRGIIVTPLENGRAQVSFPNDLNWIEGYKKGGILGGIGNGTSDSNVIRASRGEAVIPADMVSKHPDLVNGLIGGNVAQFAGGGWWKPPLTPFVGPTPAPKPAPAPATPITPGGIASYIAGKPSLAVASGTGVGSVTTPLTQREFPTAGAAQAARRGVGPNPDVNAHSYAPYRLPNSGITLQRNVGQRAFDPPNRINSRVDPKPTTSNLLPALRGYINQSGSPTPSTNSFYKDWYKKPGSANNHDPAITAKLRSQGLDNYGRPLASDTPHIPAGGTTSPGVRNHVEGPVGTGPLPGPATDYAHSPENTNAGLSNPVTTTPVPGVGSPSAPIYANTPYGTAPSGPVMDQLKSFAAQADQLPYAWGGFGPDGFDCSGLAAAMANIATGQDPLAGGRFSTANEGEELAKRGFQPGDGGPGTLTIGWDSGHTGITLPDGTHIDAQGTQSGIVMGEGSGGATGFPNVMNLPIPSDGISLPNAPILGPDGMPLAPGGTGAPPTGGIFDGIIRKMFPLWGQPKGDGKATFGTDGSLSVDGRVLPDSIQPVNIAKSLGQIGLGFLSGATGIDFSQITDPINTALGGSGSGSGGTGSADPDAAALLDQYGGGGLPGRDSGLPTGAGTSFNPKGGAGQWTSLVTQIVTQLAPQYGIKNIDGWVKDIVGQIQQESGGDPFKDNLNDSNGKGGSQQVYGLGQFLPSTFAAHNILGGDIRDPASVIAAMVDYVSSKYGMDADGSPAYINEGHGYKLGGRVRGPGSPTSDSIPAMLSRDEHVTNAMATSYYGHSVFDKLNSMSIPRDQVRSLAGGGWGGISLTPLLNPPLPGVPNPAAGSPGAPPPPAPAPPPPADAGTANAPSLPGPAPTPLGATGASGAPGATAPAPNGGAPLPQPSVQDQAGTVLGALGGIGGGGGESQPGAEAAAGASPQQDPRSVLGAAPVSNQHLAPGLKAGIEGAFQAAGNAGAAAAGAAGMAVPGLGAASSLISGGAQVAGQVASGIANIVASGLVGTASPGSTAGAYGTPLLPQAPQGNQGTVPAIQNIYNGGISTANYEQFDTGQKRREAQQAMPFLNNH